MAKKRRKAMSQISRFDKARNLVALDAVKSIRQDASGRILNAFVPGSHAKTYEVIIRREGRNYIETECLLQTGAGSQDCKGGFSAVCYHALAVLLTSARDNGLDAAICQTLQDAERRKNLSGKVYTLKSKYAPDNPLWLVVNQPEETQPDQTEPKRRKTEEELLQELGY